MESENFDKLKNLPNQIKEKIVDIQHQISQRYSYVDPNYQRLLKEASAIQREWKQLIRSRFIYAAIALIVGLCICQLMGELGVFVAVPLTLPLTIQFGWHGLRLLLQGDPIDKFPQFRQKRGN